MLLVFGLVVGVLCTRATLQVSTVPCSCGMSAGNAYSASLQQVDCSNLSHHQAHFVQAVHTEGQVVSLAKELVQHEQQVCVKVAAV